ncbi:hypothetical protein EVAR_45895_1 [Eumeta japonica]|uniref:Uncharacterized protein n=1 Tax=Eumeta variegata TaxID=151549 RepID=A0A4C1XTT1_EUMVA|nr:hypothetical protein EVAR_45895_1 [Eumeta japonica]
MAARKGVAGRNGAGRPLARRRLRLFRAVLRFFSCDAMGTIFRSHASRNRTVTYLLPCNFTFNLTNHNDAQSVHKYNYYTKRHARSEHLERVEISARIRSCSSALGKQFNLQEAAELPNTVDIEHSSPLLIQIFTAHRAYAARARNLKNKLRRRAEQKKNRTLH